MAADVTWTNGSGDGKWSTGANWTGNAYPAKNDKIIISNSDSVYLSGVDYTSGTSDKITGGSTTFVVKNGSHLYLEPNSNHRYDGIFEIEEDSSITLVTTYTRGDCLIEGTLYVKSEFSPGLTTNAINFGEKGVVKFVDGSKNSMSGNGRTLTLSATLDTGVVVDGFTTYSVETRYLIAGDSGNDFDPTSYGAITLAGGTMLGSGGTTLQAASSNQTITGAQTTFATNTLTATAEDYGKYFLSVDNKGVYVSYVKATNNIPEPATATLSLLALAGLCARRRRK